jgi:hypothetical protein
MYHSIYKMTPKKREAIKAAMTSQCPELIEHWANPDALRDALSTTDSGKPRRILGKSEKVSKGLKQGVLTAVVYLAPASMSGVDLCPWSSAGCRSACLRNHGRMSMGLQTRAQLYKSWWFLLFPVHFLGRLAGEIEKLQDKASRAGLIPAVRLNGTSDIPWEKTGIFNQFGDVEFYDYTKAPLNKRQDASNYHLTFSVSDKKGSLAMGQRYVDNGRNASIVVGDTERTADGGKSTALRIVKSGALFNRPAIDGDKTDVRFQDKPGAFVVLSAKGPIARRDETGFVKRF